MGKFEPPTSWYSKHPFLYVKVKLQASLYSIIELPAIHLFVFEIYMKKIELLTSWIFITAASYDSSESVTPN